MNRNRLASLRPLLLTFIFINSFLIFGKPFLDKKGIDQGVLIVGNLIVFAVSLLSFLMTYKSLSSSNPNSFVRAMYGGFIIKFFVLAIVSFVYIMVTNKDVNKPALLTCMGLYIVYTSLEVSALLRLLKQKKNA